MPRRRAEFSQGHAQEEERIALLPPVVDLPLHHECPIEHFSSIGQLAQLVASLGEVAEQQGLPPTVAEPFEDRQTLAEVGE